LRTTIRIKVYEGIYKGIGNEKATINGIPSSNRWSNRKDKSGDRNIPIALHKLPTR